MAEIHFSTFTPTEAAEWLGNTPPTVKDSYSLAELHAFESESEVITVEHAITSVGMYL